MANESGLADHVRTIRTKAPRARSAHKLSTWRSESPLWAGKALGPYVVVEAPGGFGFCSLPDEPKVSYPTFEAAYEAMACAAEEWAQACKPWVYFIGDELKPGRFAKVGTSTNVPKRLKQLQAYSPIVLKVHAITEGGSELEAIYHLRWARFRAHGEWFRLTPAMCREIARLGIPEAGQ